MKGDFSRLRFNQAKHYTSVLTQQGRVELDSDANEQRAIDEQWRKTATIDIVGKSGAPVDHAGFEIALNSEGTSLTFSAGRYYVDGLLCENPAPGNYAEQPYLLSPASVAEMLAGLRDGTVRSVQVFLEAWQRLVTPIDDPGIKEVALGEADTTDRLQTVWRVVAEPVFAKAPPPKRSTTGSRIDRKMFSRLALTNRITNLMQPALATLSDNSGRALLLDASATKVRNASLIGRANALAASASAQTQDGTSQDAPPALSCCEQMELAAAAVAPGRLGALTGNPDASASPCLPVPSAGYRGLENQLYRVEIHRGGTADVATFKWSRDNGSIVTSVVSTGGSAVNVDSLGPDANLGFSPTQWVELIDDNNEFGLVPNQPGQLRQIEGIDTTELKVTFNADPDALPITIDVVSGHAKLRRWDQFTADASSEGVSLSAGNWIDLENGIQICFTTTGTYTAGDYWLIPARTATGNIEWPPADSDASRFQPPRQTTIHRAPLACIHLADRQFVVESCRRLFYPLVDLAPATAVPALHVNKIGWANDSLYTVVQFARQGLQVTFDRVPDAALTPANFIVEANVPINVLTKRDLQSQWAGSLFFATPVLRISGTVTQQADRSVFRWMPPTLDVPWYQDLLGLAQRNLFVRICVTLKGRFIFASSGAQTLYLDGYAPGQPGTAMDGKTPRIDLLLPSGKGAPSSDFESWFTLVPPLEIAALTIVTDPPKVAPAVGDAPATPLTEIERSVRETSVSGTFTLAGDANLFPQISDSVLRAMLQGESITCQVILQYPPLYDTTVQLSIADATGFEQYIVLPSSVVVSAKTTSQTFIVRIILTRELEANPPTIVATLTDSGGLTTTRSLTLALKQ